MKATEDEEIINELSKEFTVRDNNDRRNAPKEFSDIANKLFAEYQIAKGDIKYDFEEIEFYLYTENHTDNKHVYPRDSKAGEWFVHYSGVDLTFQTLKDGDRIIQCGGILIRRIKKVGGASVGGPLRCLMELFNRQETPMLIKKEQRNEIAFNCTSRIGIKNDGEQDERLYRFVIENINHQINTSCPQYTKDGIVIKPKNYTYNPKNEK